MSSDRVEPLGPATAAARRHPEGRGRRARPYEQVDGDDLTGDRRVLAATRALLSVTTREEAAEVLLTALRDLGGAVVPARVAETNFDALPVDVSLGASEPLLVVVPRFSIAALHIAQHLPPLLRDATSAAERCDVLRAQAELAAQDPLTGLASRRQIPVALARARAGDVVCMVDLDGFKELNDGRGHAEGDRALRRFGELVRASLRPGDFCARYGGDEFLLLLTATPGEAHDLVTGLFDAWCQEEWHGTTASCGLALVDEHGGPAAARRADEALLHAKKRGRNCVVMADDLC